MTFKKRQNTFSALKFLQMDRNLHQWNQSLALPVAEDPCNAGRSTPPKDIKTSLFKQIWTFSQIACFMSPLWDQTLPGRTPVAPTEKPLCTLLLYDQRAAPLHNQPAAPNLLQDECPLPFNDVPLGQRTFFHLPRACCFMLDIIFGSFPPLCHEKKIKIINSFLYPFLCYLWSIPHSSRLLLLLCWVHLTCRCTGAAAYFVTVFSCPSKILFLFHSFPWGRALGAAHTECRWCARTYTAAWHCFLLYFLCLQFLPLHFWL